MTAYEVSALPSGMLPPTGIGVPRIVLFAVSITTTSPSSGSGGWDVQREGDVRLMTIRDQNAAMATILVTTLNSPRVVSTV